MFVTTQKKLNYLRRSAVLRVPKKVAISVVLISIAGSICQPIVARGDTPDPGIPQSSAAGGAVVATGTLENGSVVVPAGTNFVLWAWPTAAQLGTLSVGDSVQMQPITEAQTDSNGNFVLKLDSGTDLSEFTDSSGSIDYEVWSELDDALGNATASYDVNFSHDHPKITAPDPIQTTEPIGTKAVGTNSSGGGTGTAVSLDDSVTPNFDLRPLETTSTPASETNTPQEIAPDAISPDDKRGGPACGTFEVAKLGAKWVAVGGVYLDRSSVSATFAYKKGSTTDVGVGVSGSGKAGSFTLDGTSSASSDATWTFPEKTTQSKTIMWTEFDFAEFEHHCTNGGSQYSVRPTTFEGGTKTTTASSYPTATHCVSVAKGSKLELDYSNAVTWSSGVTLPSPISATLTSETGYDSDTNILYAFSAASKACGTHGSPSTAPSRIVVKPS